MHMHSVWKGAISFGLVNIPVNLYSASRQRELKFKLLHKKDHAEIRYARICKADNKEIPWHDVAKGYELTRGEYVILDEKDFEKANLKKTKTIEIIDFTDEGEIDSIYYEKPYFIEPAKGAAKAYLLLLEALKKSKKVAVGNYVLMHHEHLGVIKPHGDLLVLIQLRYKEELISPKGLDIPKEKGLSKNEVSMALKLVEQLSKPFNPGRYSDTYTDELKAMIKKKAKGRRVQIKKIPKSSKVHDITSLLEESLHRKKVKTS